MKTEMSVEWNLGFPVTLLSEIINIFIVFIFFIFKDDSLYNLLAC